MKMKHGYAKMGSHMSDTYTAKSMRMMKMKDGGANMGPHMSDDYTAKTMRMARNFEMTPNSSPAGVLQKGEPYAPMGMDMGNTPNSSPSDTNSGMNYGQKLVTGYPDTPAVMPLAGIPARDPNEGGASGLQKTSQAKGFTARRS